jgi:hypothetical protein
VTLAAVSAGTPREKGLAAIARLIEMNYMAEALELLPLVYRQVGMARRELNRIADALRLWEKALAEVAELAGNPTDGDPTPSVLLNAITAARKHETWEPLEKLRSRIFPANLITVEHPASVSQPVPPNI